jgi:hypothetical protein
MVLLSDTELVVQMGWAFRARIPRDTIASSRRRGTAGDLPDHHLLNCM